MPTRTFTYAPSHVGLCVTDLERSLRFYVDGLGFEVFARFDLTRPIAEVDLPVDLTSLFIQLGGLRVELLHYRSPGVFGQPSMRRNQLGITHFSLIVDDVDAAAAELEQFGGTIVDGTRSGQDDPDGVQIVFVADPDGARVELMRLAQGQDW
ncbi:MAG TPA: VOC family protein [Acidimicrobiales bacterium]|jgi:lactoylglutathione lyase|nr:VOC family protein [Acidimicrobiales bacterium]